MSAAGYDYRREVIYGSTPATTLSPAAVAAFRERRMDGVLLYSPRTGRTFRTLIESAGLDGCLDSVRVFCLSDAVADTVTGLTWADVVVAPRPEQDALLACLANS